jgi:hypothetical protein
LASAIARVSTRRLRFAASFGSDIRLALRGAIRDFETAESNIRNEAWLTTLDLEGPAKFRATRRAGAAFKFVLCGGVG